MHDDLEKFSEGLRKVLKEGVAQTIDGKRIIKSWNCDVKFQNRFEELRIESEDITKILDEMMLRMQKVLHNKTKLWVDIEEDINFFGDLRYDDSKKEIQALE